MADFKINEGVLEQVLTTDEEEIIIPEQVTKIYYSAFDKCKKLKEEIDKIETDNMEKEPGLKERTLAEWKKIYSLDDDGSGNFKITGYKGEGTDIVIPDIISKKKVTAIDEYAFSPEKERLTKKVRDIRIKITSIVIPDSVTSIGKSAFSNCSSLTSITIPDSVTSIGEGAFSDCSSLKCITIPDSVTSIGDWAFSDCSSLTGITIPDSVTSIGGRAFSNTKWKSEYPDDFIVVNGILIEYKGNEKDLIIPDSVTSIGDSAFDDCRNLTISASEKSYAIIFAKKMKYPIR